MSSSVECVRRSLRARGKKPNLDLNLNADPACDNLGQEGTSAQNRSLVVQEGVATVPAPIDVDAFDDDVIIISSPSAFAEAKNNPRRNRGRPVVVDVETEERASRSKRRRVVSPNQTIINCDLYINLEGSSNPKKSSGESVALPSRTPLPPKEPSFSCPVCMGTLVEETSTKCGHIFCKACIKTAIAAQNKCPTCRKKTTAKDLIRVYLPATRVS